MSRSRSIDESTRGELGRSESINEKTNLLLLEIKGVSKMKCLYIAKTKLNGKRISGYCASNAECSDHSLKTIQESFLKLVSFFFCTLQWKTLEKKQNLGIVESHKKKSQSENSFWRLKNEQKKIAEIIELQDFYSPNCDKKLLFLFQ